VADLDKRVAQIDRAVEAATQRGRTRGAMALVQDQKGNRADLVRERQRQAEILAAMKSEEAGLSVHRRAVATARLKAALAGADRELEFASGHQLDRRGAVLRRTATKKAVK
jgi:hypothetical protein